MDKDSKKTVKTFALASFLSDMGSDMIFPIWPLFVTTVLNANVAILGLIDGISLAIVSLSQAASGYLSDRIKKRKVFIWLGYMFSSLARLGYAGSTIWQHLVPFRMIDRAGKIRDSPRDAIVADISERSNRGKNFGIIRTMDNLGAVIGIITTLIIFGILGVSYRTLFLIAAVPTFIGSMLVLFAVKERTNHIKLYKGISFKDITPNFRLFMILSTIFALGTFTYSFLIVYANQFGFAAPVVPLLYLLFTAVAFASTFFFGNLADKIGRKYVLFMSFAFWGLSCLSFIFSKQKYGIVLAFALYGLHLGAIEPVQKAFVSELANKKYRASSLGGFQMVTGLVALPASLIAGILWLRIGRFTPFYLSIALTLLASVMLLFVKEDKK